MPGYGRRYWADRTAPNRRKNFPKFRGDSTADAVVIGGGLTGCATAFALARAGADVVLLEADRLAGAGTAGGLGIIVPQPDTLFRSADSLAGRKPSRLAWELADKSAEEFGAALKGIKANCDLAPAAFFIDGTSPDALAQLKKEQAARRDAGLAAPLVSAQAARAELGSESYGALKLTHAYRYDPVRAALAFSTSAADEGARIFEQSPVRRTRFTRKFADVHTSHGRIRTTLVVVATGEPGTLFGQLRRHTRHSTGYVVVTHPISAAMRRETGKRTAVVTDIGDQPHWLRWLAEDRAIFGGAHEARRQPPRPEGPRAAHGAAHVRAVRPPSGNLRPRRRVGLGHSRRHDARRPSVDRHAPQLSVPFLRDGARLARRRPRLARREGGGTDVQGGDGQGRAASGV
jgi:glycine/D-amino acid oxidase-like deaminating enzyme